MAFPMEGDDTGVEMMRPEADEAMNTLTADVAAAGRCERKPGETWEKWWFYRDFTRKTWEKLWFYRDFTRKTWEKWWFYGDFTWKTWETWWFYRISPRKHGKHGGFMGISPGKHGKNGGFIGFEARNMVKHRDLMQI